ncbi:unnamed protein product [Brassica rapa]|uniref:Uncharacterized protein n=2 Tax=Brassica TaxID=3705 RepID=A0A3P5YFP6_BRACM|nr:unnamed protein product [Brassica napus]CAG7865420.1 unnamed protein product [Brassica rapa]VDC62494.1 unnamed protein product [Brassica rapa]
MVISPLELLLLHLCFRIKQISRLLLVGGNHTSSRFCTR